MDRRHFLQATTAGAAGLAAALGDARIAEAQGRHVAVQKVAISAAMKAEIDRTALQYMAQRHAPGMQFALTDLHGAEYIASYGVENLQTGLPLKPGRLFQIGSISKSIAAVAILQLVEEGKLDLHKPVMEYLPWLPWSTPHGAVTLHHVLTHTTGLPGGGSLFFPGNRWQHRQRYAPGTRYFYSNMAFNVLGHLIALCDGRSYQASLRQRVLDPLGMSQSRPSLGAAEWTLQADSYMQPPAGALRLAPEFHEDVSAGCVASTPQDMARYLRLLLRRGVADGGRRILSEASVSRMTARYTDAPEWGKGAGYGYGLGVDHVHGDTVLLHTGGMVSFMSAVYLNLSRGVAAFASINAQQGYRPMPLAKYAVEALLAHTQGTVAPQAIEPPRKASAVSVATATESLRYREQTGTFVNDDPWNGTRSVTESHGQLQMDGTLLLPAGDGSWYLESETDAPDRCGFDCTVNGLAQVLLVNGTEYRRFQAG